MQLNEDLFQRSTATRHHPSTDRKSDRLTWTHTAPMGFTGWSQRDTLTTGHGHCRDNRRQHTVEVERIVRSLAARGYRLHAFGAKVLGLARYADVIASSDSASWSLRGRHLPGCTPTHRSESNCLRFALEWHSRLLTRLNSGEETTSEPGTEVALGSHADALARPQEHRRFRGITTTVRQQSERTAHTDDVTHQEAA